MQLCDFFRKVLFKCVPDLYFGIFIGDSQIQKYRTDDLVVHHSFKFYM